MRLLFRRPVVALRTRLHRWRVLLGEVWRFGVVGATNVVINFVVFNALVIVLFAGSELKANVVATAFATTTSYLMNRGWTFRHRKTSRIPREYVLFFAFNAVGLAIELAVMGAAKYGLGATSLWALNLAKGTGLGLATVFRFWSYRTFVFAGRPASSPPAPSQPAHPAATPQPAPSQPAAPPPVPRPAPTAADLSLPELESSPELVEPQLDVPPPDRSVPAVSPSGP